MNAKKKQGKLNLFEYTDYRRFLADYYNDRKKDDPRFSYRFFSKKAGLGSPSHLRDVIRGEKNISYKALDSFCKGLDLNNKERTFFENLVRYNQAVKPEAKKHFFEQLVPFFKKDKGINIKENQYEYFSNWFGPVIREMIALDDFKEDSVWISRRLNNLITPQQAKKMIQLLLELNMVERDENGKLKVKETNVKTPHDVEEMTMYSFHNQMLERAKDSLNNDPGLNREISGITAALTPAQFKQIKQNIQEFQDKTMHDLEKADTQADHVYQINFQVFALTKKREEKNGNKI